MCLKYLEINHLSFLVIGCTYCGEDYFNSWQKSTQFLFLAVDILWLPCNSQKALCTAQLFQKKWSAVALRFTACYSFRCNLPVLVSDTSPVFRIHTEPCSGGVTAPDTIQKSLNLGSSLGRVEHILIY